MSGRYDRIFLLSHMRAMTSLAGHILGSHRQINGYYEMHISYADRAALERQRADYLAHDALKPNSRYLFDKLLHNDYLLEPERLGLGPDNIRVLIALQAPAHTLRSIVHLFAQKPIEDLYASPVEAAKYYIARVEALAEFARRHPRGYCYFDAELWREAPGPLLARLTTWLGLDSPLSAEYQRFSQTGKAGKGDSSSRIQRGSIDSSRSDYTHVVLPDDVLEAAQAAYRACRRQIVGLAADALTGDER